MVSGGENIEKRKVKQGEQTKLMEVEYMLQLKKELIDAHVTAARTSRARQQLMDGRQYLIFG